MADVAALLEQRSDLEIKIDSAGSNWRQLRRRQQRSRKQDNYPGHPCADPWSAPATVKDRFGNPHWSACLRNPAAGLQPLHHMPAPSRNQSVASPSHYMPDALINAS